MSMDEVCEGKSLAALLILKSVMNTKTIYGIIMKYLLLLLIVINLFAGSYDSTKCDAYTLLDSTCGITFTITDSTSSSILRDIYREEGHALISVINRLNFIDEKDSNIRLTSTINKGIYVNGLTTEDAANKWCDFLYDLESNHSKIKNIRNLIVEERNEIATSMLPIQISTYVEKEGSFSYAKSLTELQTEEKWGWHSGQLGKTASSSELKSTGVIKYCAKNLSDLDLKTAWVEGVEGYGVGEYFTITIDEGYIPNTITFNGQFEIFNGYCKDEKTWAENSRVKTLKIYHNEKLLFIVNLKDSWQLQSFDIWPYMVHPSNKKGFIFLRKGDTLKVEIGSVYKGSKYKDTAISEFVTPSFGAN